MTEGFDDEEPVEVDPFEKFGVKKRRTARKYKKKCLATIAESVENKIAGPYNVPQLAQCMGVSKQVLYTYNLQNDPDIIAAITLHKASRRAKLIQKMEDSNDPKNLNTALRLVADEDDLRRLNTRHEISGPGEGGAIPITHGIGPEILKGIPMTSLLELLKSAAIAHGNKENV